MTAYIQRFTAYLQNNLGITEEEFKKKYRCCVKSTDTDFRRFKKMCPNIEHLPHKTKCICGHGIVDNYYFVDTSLPKEEAESELIPELQGKGLVAGFSILLLGVMIDRIAHASARKYGN